MSKILISGCGITFSGERPTWSKVLRIAGYDITDLSGPAISNQLILNQLLQELHCNKYDHVVCQLTSFGKLDVQLNDHNAWLKDNDSLRNFSYKGFWPSSLSNESKIKQMYYDYLYSPKLDEEDTLLNPTRVGNNAPAPSPMASSIPCRIGTSASRQCQLNIPTSQPTSSISIS